MATHYIFFSKKDIRINYSIVAEHRETLVLNYILHVHNKYNYKILIVVYYFFSASIVTNIEEQRLINKLDRATKKIFEVFYYCNSQYECRQQLIWQYQAWPNEAKPSVCEICDNCVNRNANKPKLLDGKEEIVKLLEVVEYLT